MSNPTQPVTVKSFFGANLEDMDDFIDPILRKKPDQLVLHIGTNDVRLLVNERITSLISLISLTRRRLMKSSFPRDWTLLCDRNTQRKALTEENSSVVCRVYIPFL